MFFPANYSFSSDSNPCLFNLAISSVIRAIAAALFCALFTRTDGRNHILSQRPVYLGTSGGRSIVRAIDSDGSVIDQSRGFQSAAAGHQFLRTRVSFALPSGGGSGRSADRPSYYSIQSVRCSRGRRRLASRRGGSLQTSAACLNPLHAGTNHIEFNPISGYTQPTSPHRDRRIGPRQIRLSVALRFRLPGSDRRALHKVSNCSEMF